MKRISKKGKIISGAVCSAAVLFSAWMIWSNCFVQTENFDIISTEIPKEFSGYKILQVSDLHNRSFGKDNTYLVKKIEAENPNIIVITGDIVDRNRTNVALSLAFVNRIVKIAPVYYVTGNHESVISEYGELKDGLEKAGVIILDNESIEITRSGKKIVLGGLMNHTDFTQEEYLKNVDETWLRTTLEGIGFKSENFNILLAHHPENFKYYSEYGADLCFCGHAHGGQVRLPFVGGLYAPNQGFLPKYTNGEYTIGECRMLVSRGLGNSIDPIRFNDRPELITAILHSEK